MFLDRVHFNIKLWTINTLQLKNKALQIWIYAIGTKRIVGYFIPW